MDVFKCLEVKVDAYLKVDSNSFFYKYLGDYDIYTIYRRVPPAEDSVRVNSSK